MAQYTFIASRDPVDGDRSVHDIARDLAKAGHDVTVFLVENGTFLARRGVCRIRSVTSSFARFHMARLRTSSGLLALGALVAVLGGAVSPSVAAPNSAEDAAKACWGQKVESPYSPYGSWRAVPSEKVVTVTCEVTRAVDAHGWFGVAPGCLDPLPRSYFDGFIDVHRIDNPPWELGGFGAVEREGDRFRFTHIRWCKLTRRLVAGSTSIDWANRTDCTPKLFFPERDGVGPVHSVRIAPDHSEKMTNKTGDHYTVARGVLDRPLSTNYPIGTEMIVLESWLPAPGEWDKGTPLKLSTTVKQSGTCLDEGRSTCMAVNDNMSGQSIVVTCTSQ